MSKLIGFSTILIASDAEFAEKFVIPPPTNFNPNSIIDGMKTVSNDKNYTSPAAKANDTPRPNRLFLIWAVIMCRMFKDNPSATNMIGFLGNCNLTPHKVLLAVDFMRAMRVSAKRQLELLYHGGLCCLIVSKPYSEAWEAGHEALNQALLMAPPDSEKLRTAIDTVMFFTKLRSGEICVANSHTGAVVQAAAAAAAAGALSDYDAVLEGCARELADMGLFAHAVSGRTVVLLRRWVLMTDARCGPVRVRDLAAVVGVDEDECRRLLIGNRYLDCCFVPDEKGDLLTKL